MEMDKLRQSVLFSRLSDSEIEKISERMQVKKIARGEVLFEQGDKPLSLCMISRGWVHLTGADGLTLASLGAGSMLGEAALFRGVPHRTGAVAGTEVEIFSLDAKALEEIISENVGIGVRLSQAYGRTLRQMVGYLKEGLKAVKSLGALPDDILDDLAISLQPQEVMQGSDIFQQGDAPRGIFWVQQGEVMLTVVSDDALRSVSSEELLGVVSTITDSPYRETAKATTPSLVWRLPLTDFRALSDKHPDLRQTLAGSVSASLTAEERREAAALLGGLPLLAGVSPEALEAFAETMSLKVVPAGDNVFNAGDPGDALYLVVKGSVTLVTSDGSAVAGVGKGDALGDVQLLTGEAHPLTAVARENTLLFVLDRQGFEEVLAHHPEVAKSIARAAVAQRKSVGMTQVEQRLRRVILFRSLSGDDLLDVAKELEGVRFKAGQTLFREGEDGATIYFIEEGRVVLLRDVNGKPSKFFTVAQGDFVGESALRRVQKRIFSAQAVEDVEAWKIYAETLESIALRRPTIAIALSRTVVERMSLIPGTTTAVPAPLTVPERQPVPVPAAPAVPVEAGPGIWHRIRQQMEVLSEWFQSLKPITRLEVSVVTLLLIWLLGVALPLSIIASVSSTRAAAAHRKGTMVPRARTAEQVTLSTPASWMEPVTWG